MEDSKGEWRRVEEGRGEYRRVQENAREGKGRKEGWGEEGNT